MKIYFTDNKHLDFKKEFNKMTLIRNNYTLTEKCKSSRIIKIIFNHLDRYVIENGEEPKFLILGVDLYESLSATNFKNLGIGLSDRCLDLEIILDYKDKLNIEVRGKASKDFIRYIKSKEK